jgi:hypothetical protein
MTDLQQIKAQYAAMGIAQLQELLEQADTLREDAQQALREECNRRRMNTTGIPAKGNVAAANIRPEKTREQKQWWHKTTAWALEQKFNDASDDNILAGLIGMRASNDECHYILERLKSLAEEEQKQAVADRLNGVTKLVCGLAIIIIVYLASLGNTMTIIAGSLAAFGLVQIMNAGYRKNRYETILVNIANTPQPPAEKLFNPDDVIFEEVV